MAENEEKRKENRTVNEVPSETPEGSTQDEISELKNMVKEMEETLKKENSEMFDLKIENIKLKEKLRQESEIF